MIRGITNCLLCGKTFTGPAYALIGQGKEGDVIRYMNEVQKHFVEKHPEESEATQNRSLEFLTMLRMMNFKTTDSGLKEQVQFLRWQIHQQVMPVRIPDEKLEERSAEYANEIFRMLKAAIKREAGTLAASAIPASAQRELIDAIQKKTSETIRALRDLYEEPNRYNLQVVSVGKDEEPESEPAETQVQSPQKPLLVLPD
jgi:hypothetical protein